MKEIDAFVEATPGKPRQRKVEVIPKEPLTAERRDEIVTAAFLWAYARGQKNEGRMSEVSYRAYKKKFLALLECTGIDIG